MSVGLFGKTTSKTGNAPDVFRGGDINVKVFGCGVVAICNICVLGEWMICFGQNTSIEVEAVCGEGVDGYGAGFIKAFTAGWSG